MSIHIYVPTGLRFQGRVRRHGYRRYEMVGRPRKTVRAAFLAMSKEFASGKYKRGDVVSFANYYDPRIEVEVIR